MTKPYFSNKERLICEICQWEIHPNQKFYAGLEFEEFSHFDKYECIEEWKKTYPHLKDTVFQERIFKYESKPDGSSE